MARILPDVAGAGYLPPNDLAAFLEHKAPAVRAAALLSVNVKKPLPREIRQAVLDRLGDKAPEVREAAMLAVVPLKLREAIPTLLFLTTAKDRPDDRAAAISALCGLPDPRAMSVYLDAIDDHDPRLRRAGEAALLAIRDRVRGSLAPALASGRFSESASLILERVIARFEPVRDWRVIGPFPRTTPRLFVGDATINFAQPYPGAEGRVIRWQSRDADPKTGRVDLSDLKGGAGDRGGFGYDANGSPDLCAFGYAEIHADRPGPALVLVGSSGSLTLTLNEKPVYQYQNFAGRGYAPATDTIRVELAQGINRILAVCREGIGTWSFGIEVARIAPRATDRKVAAVSPAELTRLRPRS